MEKKHVETEAAAETPFQDAEPEGGHLAASSDIGAGDNKELSPEAFDSADDDESGEDAGESDTDWYDDWSDADSDLDEVIKELEADLKEVSHDEEEKEEMKEGWSEGAEEGTEEKEDEKEEEKADEAYPAEDPEAGVCFVGLRLWCSSRYLRISLLHREMGGIS